MADDVIDALKRATDGLLYPSERDQPFDVINWPAGSSKSAADEIGKRVGADSTIERSDVASFFDALAGSDDAQRFPKLRATLTKMLTDVAVYRVKPNAASAQVAIYIVGRLPSGGWAGVHTTSIET